MNKRSKHTNCVLHSSQTCNEHGSSYNKITTYNNKWDNDTTGTNKKTIARSQWKLISDVESVVRLQEQTKKNAGNKHKRCCSALYWCRIMSTIPSMKNDESPFLHTNAEYLHYHEPLAYAYASFLSLMVSAKVTEILCTINYTIYSLLQSIRHLYSIRRTKTPKSTTSTTSTVAPNASSFQATTHQKTGHKKRLPFANRFLNKSLNVRSCCGLFWFFLATLAVCSGSL